MKDDSALRGSGSRGRSRGGSRAGSRAEEKRSTNVSIQKNGQIGVSDLDAAAAATKGTLPEIKQKMKRLGTMTASDDAVKDLPDLTKFIITPKKDSILGSDDENQSKIKIIAKDDNKRGIKHRGLDFVKLNRRIVYPNALKFATLSNSIDEIPHRSNLLSPIAMPLSVRDSVHKAAMFRNKIL